MEDEDRNQNLVNFSKRYQLFLIEILDFFEFFVEFNYQIVNSTSFLFRLILTTNSSYFNIQSRKNRNNLIHLAGIVLFLTSSFCRSDAIPLIKFNRWQWDDGTRRGYNDLATFPYKASNPRPYPPYPLIDPFHNYFVLPHHRKQYPLQQQLSNIEPLQRSILSNTEVIKVSK